MIVGLLALIKKIKMGVKVYSAAKAVTLKKGQSKKEVWKNITKMFSIEDKANYSVKTFIYGGYRFEDKVTSIKGNNETTIGDVFKAVTVHGTVIYVTIKEWNPYNSFSYDEQMWSEGDSETSVPTRTDFKFIEHPEGATLEIVRREKADLKMGILDFIMGRKKNNASWAAGRFCHIIGGQFPTLKNEETLQVGEFIIKRDDSLRKEF